MSFILDALRKSENERQRDSAPVLARAPLALVRRETPIWSWLAIGLLSLALIGLGTAWWLRPPADPADAGGSAAVAAGANPPAIAGAGSGSIAGPTPPTGVGPQTAAGPATAVSPAATTGGYGTGAASETTTIGSAEPRPIEDLRRLDPSLPEYRLSLLASNSAYIDGRRYAPGQRIGDGPEVVAVRPDGVVLAWRGERFLLPLR